MQQKVEPMEIEEEAVSILVKEAAGEWKDQQGAGEEEKLERETVLEKKAEIEMAKVKGVLLDNGEGKSDVVLTRRQKQRLRRREKGRVRRKREQIEK